MCKGHIWVDYVSIDHRSWGDFSDLNSYEIHTIKDSPDIDQFP